MRVLIVAPMVPRRQGSGAIPILLYAELVGLRERGDVTLLSAVGDEPGEATAGAALVAAGFDVRLADRRLPGSARARWRRRMRLAAAWLRGGRPWRAIWFADPGIQRLLDEATAAQSFDLVLVEDSAMAGYRLPAGLPSALVEHEVLRPRTLTPPPSDPRAWPRWALSEIDWRRRPGYQRRAWNRYERLLVFSERDREAVAELAPEVAARVRVSPFGLMLPEPADPAAIDPGNVLFVGNFTHQPNRDAARWLAREIMPALWREQPGASLTIVGSSPPQAILSLAGDGVEVFADAPSIRPHLERAAVVAAPIRTGGGMRMKVLEAMAAAKAVVTTPRGVEGFDCFEEHPPLRVAAAEEDDFAAAVGELLADPKRRAELSAAARDFAEAHYSPGAWAERLETLLPG